MAALQLAEHGFFAKELNTGWTEWQQEGLPVHERHDLPTGGVRCDCSVD